MEKREILRRLVSIVSDVTVQDEEDIDSDCPIEEIEALGDLDDFASAVYDEFDIEIDSELDDYTFETLGDVVNFIYRRSN